jgi:hypothetical protein
MKSTTTDCKSLAPSPLCPSDSNCTIPFFNDILKFHLEKFRLSYEQWPWSNVPPYVTGGGYLIAGCAIHRLLAAAQVTPFIWLEDLFLSGLLAEKVGITLRPSIET